MRFFPFVLFSATLALALALAGLLGPPPAEAPATEARPAAGLPAPLPSPAPHVAVVRNATPLAHDEAAVNASAAWPGVAKASYRPEAAGGVAFGPAAVLAAAGAVLYVAGLAPLACRGGRECKVGRLASTWRLSAASVLLSAAAWAGGVAWGPALGAVGVYGLYRYVRARRRLAAWLGTA